jgi:hypothetical protein
MFVLIVCLGFRHNLMIYLKIVYFLVGKQSSSSNCCTKGHELFMFFLEIC